jgi:hypothetical protein
MVVRRVPWVRPRKERPMMKADAVIDEPESYGAVAR